MRSACCSCTYVRALSVRAARARGWSYSMSTGNFWYYLVPGRSYHRMVLRIVSTTAGCTRIKNRVHESQSLRNLSYQVWSSPPEQRVRSAPVTRARESREGFPWALGHVSQPMKYEAWGAPPGVNFGILHYSYTRYSYQYFRITVFKNAEGTTGASTCSQSQGNHTTN